MNSKAILFISGGVVTGTALLFTHAKSNPVKNASKAPRNNGETWDSNWDNRENAKPRGTRNIIMIRHGQYNREGKNDLEKTLTELGKKQAVYTGIRLVELGLDKKLDIVYESTKTRALETSELIYRQLNKDIPILKTDLLREGSPTWPDPPFDSSFMPDEETVTQDFVKMERAFAHLMHRADADQNDDTYELYVCHGNLIRFFVCNLLQLPTAALHRWRLRHCSITWLTIRPSGNVSLRMFGDAGHLPPNQLTFD